MHDLSNEVALNVLQPFESFRFVRMLVDGWNRPQVPAVRSLQNAIVCGYTATKAGGVRRLFYVLADASVCDGMQLDPNVLDDPHGGEVIVAQGVACCRTPATYSYLPDEARNAEVRRRASHVSYWVKQAKLTAPKPTKPRKTYWQSLWS